MKISTKSKYGLRAMTYLTKNKGFCSVHEISKEEDIPFDYLEKILGKLKKARLVSVKRGSQGGYALSSSPDKITVAQIIRVFEEPFSPVKCITDNTDKKCPRNNTCAAKKIWQTIQKNLMNTLNSLTLSSYINTNDA